MVYLDKLWEIGGGLSGLIKKIMKRDLIGATITDVELCVQPIRTETGVVVELVSVLSLEVNGHEFPCLIPSFEGPATEQSLPRLGL